MMNRAEQNWPEDETHEITETHRTLVLGKGETVTTFSVPTDYPLSNARDYSESFVDWALRVIDNALESR